MPVDPRSPVIVGVGQHLHRAEGLDDALSPVDLMAEAVQAAAADSGGADVLSHAQSVRIVQLLSWRYRDPAALLAARLGMQPAETAYTTAGGNTPQSLVNQTALEILDGTLDCAVLSGGEAWRTRMRARRTETVLDWEKQEDTVEPTRMIGSEMKMNHPYELERGVVMPVQVYPMFETALRAQPARQWRITRCARPRCGPGSARSHRRTPTRGCGTRSPRSRSAHRRPRTA